MAKHYQSFVLPPVALRGSTDGVRDSSSCNMSQKVLITLKALRASRPDK